MPRGPKGEKRRSQIHVTDFGRFWGLPGAWLGSGRGLVAGSMRMVLVLVAVRPSVSVAT